MYCPAQWIPYYANSKSYPAVRADLHRFNVAGRFHEDVLVGLLRHGCAECVVLAHQLKPARNNRLKLCCDSLVQTFNEQKRDSFKRITVPIWNIQIGLHLR